jgi:ABC-type transport system involved in multi-copper enzyme maturation permease subunit
MATLKSAQWQAMIKDTILKELRSKTLLFLFIATTLMILLAHSLLKMFINSQDPGTNILVSASNSLNYMFSAMNFWSLVIAAIFGISAVRSDFREKIIHQYLALPISRTQYMFSRIAGAWLLVFGYYLYAYMLSTLLFSIATHSLALTWGHLASMVMMGLYIFLVVCISLFYSLFMGKIGSFILLMGTVFTISLSTHTFRELQFAEYFKNFSLFKLLGLLVYSFFPRINYVTEVANWFMFKEELKLNIPLESLHLLATSAFFLFLADRIIKRKNF